MGQYEKLVWKNNETPLNEANMNHIENAIESLMTQNKDFETLVGQYVDTKIKALQGNLEGEITNLNNKITGIPKASLNMANGRLRLI